MATLRIEDYTLPSASMGTDNPLPDLQRNMDAHANIAIDTETVSAEESRYMGWGRVNGILPYTIRDGYDRDKKPKTWRAAVLENQYLRATFLPEWGGRLASLYDLEAGRELLHKNPVFQPCNLGLRNAWISGGVEWNLGIIGHTPFTVDTLFAETLTFRDGTPALRMYQYERVRDLVYQITVFLPDDSRHLFVRVRIDNASKRDTAVYWWSNMAVDEGENIRVIVPSARAFRFGYGGKLKKMPVPYHNDWDVSHTTQLPQAMDFFFDIPEGRRRFIAAVDENGYGFCQTSSDVLQGRKLFVWGMGQGGRNWQTFLAAPGCAYIEIQAGLAHTQLEHLPMAGGQTIAWIEAYGAIQADGKIAQGADYQAAGENVEAALDAILSRNTLDDWGTRVGRELDGVKGTRLFWGDGWGALEQATRGADFLSGGLNFPKSSMKSAEREWLQLAETGALPVPNPLLPPKGYQISDDWLGRLTKSLEAGHESWFAFYHLGVMRAYRNDLDGAEEAFQKSLQLAESPWALRCLAVLAAMRDEKDKAADLYLRAVGLVPQRQLALEALKALYAAGRYAELARLVDTLPRSIRSLGRAKALLIDALLELGELKQAERMLKRKIVLTDVREGEVSLTDSWFKLCAKKRALETGEALDAALLERVKAECPPPEHLDFRMQ